MKNRKAKRLVALLAVLILTFTAAASMFACTPEQTETVYTYNEYIARFPSSWSTHNATSDADMYVQKYAEIGLYAYTLNADKTSYAFVDEMATGDPVNVTATYKDSFGITESDLSSDKVGKAWEITLNPDATWENGTAITADDYVWSMERVLSSEMKNSLSAAYITGETEIYNAKDYYNGGSTVNYVLNGEALTAQQVTEGIAEKSLQFSLTNSNIILGKYTLQYYHDLMPRNHRFFRKDKMEDEETLAADTEGVYRDWYAYLTEKYGSSADEYGYIKVTESNRADIEAAMNVLSENIGAKNLPAWYNATSILEYVENEEVPFEEVGIFKTGEMKFVIVFKNALSLYQVKDALTENWIAYKPYYEAGYSNQGSLKLTSYGTTSGQYMGYGPYKLVSYETDKQLVFERNTNWYGYNQDACNYHEGEFMTDRIVCKVIANQATALLEFESGNLDNVVLSANDMDKYKFSDYLLKRTASNTWSISFNSNLEKLKALESDSNGNRQILSVYEFRKALSLSIDRSYIGQNIMVGSAAAFSFINSNYYYDMENDPTSVYRDTTQAKQAICKLYGIEYGEGKTYKTLDEAYKAISGYDIDSAKQNFITAYEKAVDAGIYTKGDNIRITVYNTSTSAKFTSLIGYIQQKVNEATVGTALEGKITITTGVQQNGLADAIHNGTVEARYYSFAGDYANPNGMIANFTDTKANTIPECGFDPNTEVFSVTADFDGTGVTTKEMTYDAWQKSIAAGGQYATASIQVKLDILSQLEYNLLNGFRTIPICVGTDLTLRSKKVNYATDNANIFVAYGGVRLMTYNYSDAQWAEFCKTQSNLKYE